MNKQYLGDGVYAEVDIERESVKLTTEDGSCVTNTIWLDPETYKELKGYIDRFFEVKL